MIAHLYENTMYHAMTYDQLHKRLMDLFGLEREASENYFTLRDAKSNGCCSGMSIGEILAYDDQLVAASRELQELRDEIRRVAGWLTTRQREQA